MLDIDLTATEMILYFALIVLSIVNRLIPSPRQYADCESLKMEIARLRGLVHQMAEEKGELKAKIKFWEETPLGPF